ncbi:MAG TPA: glycosyltransferase family 39 protein [Anaerolineaceae bacterium]|nr:glycosyltransferase family 39 protein [Anaerolineaceae bacterium]HPN50846.1 glycosyltransferase family 39 protein [Anaerolineaceae bacterium]
MARHVLQGEQALFFWGQAYMGSMDAYLVAGAFLLLGESVFAIRVVQILLLVGTVITTAMLGRQLFHSSRVGLIAALLVALPTVNGVLYTTASLGGYGEALLIGNFILLLAAQNISGQQSRVFWGLLGFLGGLGFWTNGLTLVYFIPAWILVVKGGWRPGSEKEKSRLLWGGILFSVVGFAIGASPWLVFLINGGSAAIHELFGSAVNVEQTFVLVKWGNHLISFLLLGLTVIFGFRPPWSVHWLGLPLMPFILMFWGWTAAQIFFEIRRRRAILPAFWLLLGVMACVAGGFVFTSFGIDPSGRYFLPFITPMALLAGWAVSTLNRRWLQFGLVALVCIFHFWGIIDSASAYPPGLTTQFDSSVVIDHRYDGELLAFLRDNQLNRGYTHYWIGYPVAFLSQEKLIFVPKLPYHGDLRYTPRDDRYSPYDEQVRNSRKITYITAKNPALDEKLTGAFRAHQIQYQEKWIGDYHVFYNLSQPVHPEMMGLGTLKE